MTLVDTWDFLLVQASCTYDVSTYFILQIITKFKRRFGSDIRIKVVKIEFNENENSKILIKIQEEIEKLADMLAKDENKNKIK